MTSSTRAVGPRMAWGRRRGEAEEGSGREGAREREEREDGE